MRCLEIVTDMSKHNFFFPISSVAKLKCDHCISSKCVTLKMIWIQNVLSPICGLCCTTAEQHNITALIIFVVAVTCIQMSIAFSILMFIFFELTNRKKANETEREGEKVNMKFDAVDISDEKKLKMVRRLCLCVCVSAPTRARTNQFTTICTLYTFTFTNANTVTHMFKFECMHVVNRPSWPVAAACVQHCNSSNNNKRQHQPQWRD